MVPVVMEPSCLRLRCYEPVIVGAFMVTTLPDVVGIKYDLVGLWLPPYVLLVGLGLPPCQMLWHYLRCNSGDLASTSSQMCDS